TPPTKNKASLKAVQTTSVTIEPAQAKRGQTVMWTLTLDLAPGWYTYPTAQSSEKAGSSVTTFTFPPPGDTVFVDKLKEPEPHTKNLDGLTETPGQLTPVQILDGKVVFQRPFVVSPNAEPGEKKIPVTVEVIVCNAQGQCLLPTKLPFVASLAVTSDPPMPVEAKYAREVPGTDSPSRSGPPNPVPIKESDPPPQT